MDRASHYNLLAHILLICGLIVSSTSVDNYYSAIEVITWNCLLSMSVPTFQKILLLNIVIIQFSEPCMEMNMTIYQNTFFKM